MCAAPGLAAAAREDAVANHNSFQGADPRVKRKGASPGDVIPCPSLPPSPPPSLNPFLPSVHRPFLRYPLSPSPSLRATLQDGRTVAIKRLALGSTQGEREFQAEMQTLGNIRHRNLVTLVAAYIAPGTGSERLLIYNFLPGGSLDGILAGDMAKDSPFRKWEVRRSVALDTARGMKYLHHDCTPRIIHRDMKPANVLLDDELVARVADFGLAREVDMSRSHMSTAVSGVVCGLCTGDGYLQGVSSRAAICRPAVHLHSVQ